MPSSHTPPRKHGLQPPFNKYQTMSWGLFGAELAGTILVFLPPLDNPLRIAGGAIMLFLLCSTFFCAFKSSIADPTDPTVYEERKMRSKGEDFVTELKHYCSICDTHVLTRTKHCGKCNRCVNIFDHHCIWLNNCVGARNYRYFAGAITMQFLNSCSKLAFGGYIISKFYKDYEEFDDQAQQFYNTDASLGFLNYFVIISCALNLIFWLMMLQLIILHLYLYFQKLTTYEYIVKKRDIRALAKAQKEGGKVVHSNSKVIRQLQEEDQTGRSLPPEYTVARLVNKSKPSVSYDISNFYASHDTTKDHQEYLRQKLGERPETSEPFGTCVTSMQTHHGTTVQPERKIQPMNQTPAAVLHETSMSDGFSGHENSVNNTNKNVDTLYEKESKDMPESATKSHKSFSTIKENHEEDIPTMRDQYAPRIQEDIRHLSFPEVMDCEITVDKSLETSKIMKFMETISHNVVMMKNPLSKIMFMNSGFDTDAQKPDMVTSPKAVQKRPLPKLDLYKNLQNFKPIGSPHELKLLKSDLYYINSPNRRFEPMFSPSSLLPNSCRVTLDKKTDYFGNHPYMTERPGYLETGVAPLDSDDVADDKSIYAVGLATNKKEEPFKNPFFRNYQE